VTVRDAMSKFLENLVCGNYSKASIKSYRFTVGKFARYLETAESCTEITAMNSNQIINYCAYLQTLKKETHAVADVKAGEKSALEKNTIAKLVNAVKQFTGFLYLQEFIAEDLSCAVPKVKGKEIRSRVILSAENIDAICNVIDMHSLQGFRDRVIIELVYTAGLRIGEVLLLDVADIDLRNDVITVRRGKGNKARLVPLLESAKFLLKEYISQVRPYLLAGVQDDCLMVNRDGRRLKVNTIIARIREYGSRAGVRVTSHMFRHAFSVHMMRRGCDVKYISTLLGHASLETTQVYTAVSDEDLREKLETYHFLKNPDCAIRRRIVELLHTKAES